MTDEQTWSYVQAAAKQMGLPVHVNTSNSWPLVWLSNRYRDETQLKAPQFLGGFYGVAHDSAQSGALSWNSQAGEDALLGVFQETVRRFAGDPNVVGWLEPHAETGETPQGHFLEYGPLADKTMRQFLLERYGSLAAVSLRWHGEPRHLKSWADVRVPEVAEFAGFGPDAIDLRGTWRVKYVPAVVPAEWYGQGFDDSGWDEFVAPGNDRMLTIPRRPLVYRRTIDVPSDWLNSPRTVTLYVWDMSSRDKEEIVVSVNGRKVLGQPRGNDSFHWAIFDVTKALQAGLNHFAMTIPRAIICYRAYLTGVQPAQYPDLGPQKNAQWADYVHWRLWSRKAQLARGVEMIRQVDPDRSINLMAVEYTSPFRAVAQDYGCRFHDTGGMAGFWNEEPPLMMTGIRFPTSAEPGSPAPDAAQFQAFFGRWITEGVNGVHYFGSMGDIQWKPDVLKCFEANRRMYEAIGKYHAPFAEVGILYSTISDQLGGFPWETDRVGRGFFSGTNAANYFMDYCPRAGVTEEDFGTPNVKNFRMIVDTDTRLMNERLIGGIEAYVRNGGVFVTNGQTGRHDEVYPDTWPISRLTGYQVLNPSLHGHTAAAPGQTILSGPDWADPRDDSGQVLKKIAPGCRDLLLWSDGTTAIGMRPLGKGWVVNVGSSRDVPLVMLRIAAHFGIKRVPATCTCLESSPAGYRPHFRHFIGNTGLQDIWVIFNERPDPITATLTFLPGVHPSSLTDIVRGENVLIVRADAGDAVPNIPLAAWQTVTYVSPRADVAASPLEWLELQRGWWAGTKKPPAKRLPTKAEMQRFTLDLTDGWAYKRIDDLSDEQATVLAMPALDDHTWERRTLDLWLAPGAPKAQRVLLRRTFTVPAHWAAGTVLLCSQLPGGDTFLEARHFVDGKLLYDGHWNPNGPYDHPLDGQLKPGTTHHVALDIRSPTPLIGVRCPFWLSYTPDPVSRQDLSGEWQGYADEMRRVGPIDLPGRAKNVHFVSHSVVIDKAHEGRNVVIYARTANGEMIRGLLFNGRRLDPAAVGYERHDLIINVTPMVLFGEENTVEFTFNSTPEGTPIEAAEIRYYAKGVYP